MVRDNPFYILIYIVTIWVCIDGVNHVLVRKNESWMCTHA